MIDQAVQVSRRQAQMAVEVGKAMTAGFSSLVDASMGFATATAERQMNFATAILSAKSPEAAAELQRAFLNNSLQAAGVMATQIAAAYAVAARPFEVSAAQPTNAATASGA